MRPINSLSATATPAAVARRLTSANTACGGVTLKSVRFIETCTWPREANGRPNALTQGKPPLLVRMARAILLRDAQIFGFQIDVIGDQDRARSHNHGAGRSVKRRSAQVWPFAFIVERAFAQSFELALAHLLQFPARWSQSRCGVEVNRNLQFTPNPVTRAMRQGHAILHRGIAQRHERQHVERS